MQKLMTKNQTLERLESQVKLNYVLKYEDILKKNIEYNKNPKKASCFHCSKELSQLGLIVPFKNKVLIWGKFERCTCIKSRAYWEKYDLKELKDKKAEKINKKIMENEKRLKKLFKDSKISKRFQTRTMKNFIVDAENKVAYENSKLYIENFEKFKENGEGLFFKGDFGTGKTHLAVAIAIELMKKGVSVISITSIDLLAELKRTYDKDRHISEHQLLRAYKETELLIIDDLGKEYSSEWSLANIYNIINHRYEYCKPTIITTNYSDIDLERRWSINNNKETAGAITSRMKEMTLEITLNGKDKRAII